MLYQNTKLDLPAWELICIPGKSNTSVKSASEFRIKYITDEESLLEKYIRKSHKNKGIIR